jgi:hypothetical protein
LGNVGNAFGLSIWHIKKLDSSFRWNDKLVAVIPMKTGIQKKVQTFFETCLFAFFYARHYSLNFLLIWEASGFLLGKQ